MPHIAPDLYAILKFAATKIEVVSIRPFIILLNCFGPLRQELVIDIVYVNLFTFGIFV